MFSKPVPNTLLFGNYIYTQYTISWNSLQVYLQDVTLLTYDRGIGAYLFFYRCHDEMNAGGGTRTLTLSPGRDFESRASASSATPAKDAKRGLLTIKSTLSM